MRASLAEVLCCPSCRAGLQVLENDMRCSGCDRVYKLHGDVPELVAPDNPLFGGRNLTTMAASGFNTGLVKLIGILVPSPSFDIGARRLKRRLGRLLKRAGGRCLIIGAGEDSEIVDLLRPYFNDVAITDIVLAPGSDVVCDGGELPFVDGAFDCVVAMAVLEHVLDPGRVVAEFHRVLAMGGLVIADTPFMQQVHMRQYDYTRFTDLGYRWLFRGFDEVERGVSVGPASAVVWSIVYLFRSLATGRRSALLLSAIARLLFFWIKYFDFFLTARPGAFDSAAGFYFLGRKSSTDLTEADLLRGFRGL